MSRKIIVPLAVLFGLSAAAGEAQAKPAPPISSFGVYADTSAMYNPVLPSPLTPATALNMDWDIMTTTGSLQFSTRPNGGDWIGFITQTIGYEVGAPTATYTSSMTPVIYFGTFALSHPDGSVFGWLDEFYCTSCTSPGTFSAQTTSIITGQGWFGEMFLQ